MAMMGISSSSFAQSLDEDLRRELSTELATSAKSQGDAMRGAVVFFQQYMACSKCHSVGGETNSMLGPDLTKLGQDVRDDSLVEAVLDPSKVIRKGFESVTLSFNDGTSKVGILVTESSTEMSMRDVARNGELITVKKSNLDEIVRNSKSIMPAGQVNQLASRQQFLDLIRYLMEIRDGGGAKAKALQPSPALLTFTLPEYESHLDHAGLIRTWDAESLKRGEAIYRRVCMNCHGTKEQPGSLPTSLRFADGRFKNGHDPYAMYQTITRGFGLMAAQTWMVPSQKYDVIHYIRETYLRPYNASQLSSVDDGYLARLPKGDTRGPEPRKIEPWNAMDYGPTLTHTYEVPGPTHNIAYKGIAIRLDPGAGGVSRGRYWSLFDTDTLRVAAVWSSDNQAKMDSRFIDWRDIQMNGEHNIHPTIVGNVACANSTNPGWANPQSGDYVDQKRVLGRDGLQYGPLPRDWGKFKGLYHYENRAVLSYSIGKTEVLESPQLLTQDEPSEPPVLIRTFNLGPRDHELEIQLTDQLPHDFELRHENTGGQIGSDVGISPLKIGSQIWGVAPRNVSAQWVVQDHKLRLKIHQGLTPLKLSVWLKDQTLNAKTDEVMRSKNSTSKSSVPAIPDSLHDLAPLTKGGAPRWPQKLETRLENGIDEGPFVEDMLRSPESNPWLAQLRFTGLDFLPDGRIAVCTWDGDVWLVEISAANAGADTASALRWQRIATGLFQPLGLKVVDGQIHLICRDQLCVLHDLNGDGETDFYECLNNDHQVTAHFHEFAMGLQTDDRGNFYYAKSGRHALEAVVPQHGTLLRISKDGSHTDILANGFRAANGVCLNPDGSFVVTDQEGFWNPKNRINWVTLDPSGKPKFYGNMLGYHDVTDSSDSAMEPPLCWITNAFDRSPAELLWVTSKQWGALQGSLLNLSYGYGKVYIVPHEKVNGVMQGGMISLPIPSFPTGIMRGRFNPTDSQLYLCGMFAWAGSATQPGGLYRLRATGKPMNLPIGLHATKSGLKLIFTDPLDQASIAPERLAIKIWAIKRTAKYGSEHYNETPLKVQDARLLDDGKTVVVDIEQMQPTWCMEINYAFRSSVGKPVEGTIHNTVHELGE